MPRKGKRAYAAMKREAAKRRMRINSSSEHSGYESRPDRSMPRDSNDVTQERRIYMREYKKKQRLREEYALKERVENRKRMKRLRANPEYVKKETIANRKRRKMLRANPEQLRIGANPEYVKRETIANRKRIKMLRANPKRKMLKERKKDREMRLREQ